MGIDFTAILDHNLDLGEIYILPQLLNSAWQNVRHLLPVLQGYPVPGTAPTEWRWQEGNPSSFREEFELYGSVTIQAPDGFLGHAGRCALNLYHMARWWSFLTDKDVRHKLGGICREVALGLGAGRIIYIPDGYYKPEAVRDLIYEGKGAEEMIEWLRQNCGPPAERIESILREEGESWSGNGYYIETL